MEIEMKPFPALANQARDIFLMEKGKKEKIFYYDSGEEEKQPLILIHGLGDEADSWRNVIPLLKEKYRTIAPDLPGFGRSGTRRRINIKRHIEAVLKMLEISGPAILAGNSLGGLIASAAAFKKPEMVKGLILIDGGFPLEQKTSFSNIFSGVLKTTPFFGNRWYRKFRKNHNAAYYSLFNYYHNIEALPETERVFLRERVIERVESRPQERAYFGTIRSLIWFTLSNNSYMTKKLAEFSGKILFLWGENDKILPLKTAGLIRKIRPDAPFFIIPDAGHLPHQENPAITARYILDF